ncbi:TonB-dependent receptor [Sphingomonas naphthae]|uniref:TonB-dependent receptor n=1 Tax=Sphingomonas naphthae TaxID=1813468 RepID=A0ABY7TG65_9SPHN|nr:TonB-dependent receptor [Sphingomonas naphthae]WCT72217.1 TonB-dependent receptor [Sphingomonas naphthae]
MDVSAGTLGRMLPILAAQTGISVGFTDPTLLMLPTRRLRGRYQAGEALARLVRGLPVRVVRIDAVTWRIEPAPRGKSPPPHRPAPPPPAPAEPALALDIVITASKRPAIERTYPGSAFVIGGADLSAVHAGQGTAAVLARLPSLSSTHLGPGRNKLFIRGVADSSFNGPTQATVGQYLGEIRLNYNAPDPDIELYDVRAIEVLEGPQGTLYGAGSLGGIMRIVPEPVRMSDWSGKASAGLSLASRGQGGGDLAGMVNAPILPGTIGLRGMAFHTVAGGYIDDVGRGLRNVNRTQSDGGRAALRIEPGNDWSVELNGAIQNIATADGQYAQRPLPKLERSNVIAQPFDNDFLLAGVTIEKSWGDLKLLSANGAVRHKVESIYDFSPDAAHPTAFVQDNRIALFTSENRLSRHRPDGTGWLVGVNVVHDQEKLTRALGALPDPPRIQGVSNAATQGALFAEGTLALRRNLLATVGGRVEVSRLVGEALDQQPIGEIDAKRTEVTVLPSLALQWTLSGRATAYARYQEGFRAGGLSQTIAANASIARFTGDSLALYEIGARLGRPGAGRFDASASLSYVRWETIQADLVDMGGLPYTANIGNGRIFSAEARGAWRPVRRLSIDGAIAFNDSRLTTPAAGFEAEEASDLPNIARLSGRMGLAYSLPLASRWALSGAANLRYIGRSRLGVGPELDLRQGGYFETNAGVRLVRGRLGLSIDMDNMLNSTASRFALGNPFDVAKGLQVVPQRPRTLRIGVDVDF